MDMLLSASDSLSFQEMLDVDIKSEIETVLSSHNDFNPFSFSDIPPLELDEPQSDLNTWFSNNSNHSSSNFNIDFIGSEGAALMVNPNSVMPLTLVTVPKKEINKTNNTIEGKTNSPKIIKEIKKEKPIGKTIKMITPSLGKPILKPNLTENKQNSVLNIKNSLQRQISTQNIRVLHSANRNKNQFSRFNQLSDDKVYPKPAYSYSCLIAMALKNSRTGSLPVSEIYNFMCEHFPYFKTAPTGWKNSVRHNLSLNKCFEKIEKPAMSGAQRKGCLWAMNPNKISKMDEEVQKWSRKDPTAIRKAMINPEHLEALERGELKYSYSSEDGYADSNGDTESEEASDVEIELENQSIKEEEEETELNNHDDNDMDFIDVNNVKEEEEEEELGFDIEVNFDF